MPVIEHNGLQLDHITAGEQGPPVMLLHSSVSGNRQWRKLIALLSSRYRVIAPNLRGYGATTPWPLAARGAKQTLLDAAEVVTALCEALQLQEEPLRLVGHSFGGALALHCAHALGARVSHLVLYEPMLPGLLAAHGRTEAAAETAALHADVHRLSDGGEWHVLGQRFIDYFNGDGAWQASPPERQQAIAEALAPNVHEWDAAMAPVHANSFAPISARTLLMRGRCTRRALSEMVDVLHRRFMHWRRIDLAGCGHMAPLTHADQVNPHIMEFLMEEGAGVEVRAERADSVPF
jgi:pimeloyl-ACP methyl ester carboxylesterase